MNTASIATFRFYGDVKQFLAPGNRRAPRPSRAELAAVRSTGVVRYSVTRRASVKDVVEALGVPHTEVGGMTMDGRDIDFSELLRPGVEIHVHPLAVPFDVTRPSLLRPKPLPHTAFAVDVNVGKLATLLRLLGLDAVYDNSWTDEQLADLARDEMRIVLTRDRHLLHRNSITHARLLRAQDPKRQLVETLRFFGIKGPFDTFTRCLHCNDPLEPVDKKDILHRLQPLTKKYFDTFHTCPSCRRIYWPGSHHQAMHSMLDALGIQAR